MPILKAARPERLDWWTYDRVCSTAAEFFVVYGLTAVTRRRKSGRAVEKTRSRWQATRSPAPQCSKAATPKTQAEGPMALSLVGTRPTIPTDTAIAQWRKRQTANKLAWLFHVHLCDDSLVVTQLKPVFQRAFRKRRQGAENI